MEREKQYALQIRNSAMLRRTTFCRSLLRFIFLSINSAGVPGRHYLLPRLMRKLIIFRLETGHVANKTAEEKACTKRTITL